MLFVFAGVPKPFCDRLKARAIRELPVHSFTYRPLEKLTGYQVTEEYCNDVIESATKYARGNPSKVSDGIGDLLLLRPWERDCWRSRFNTFALYSSVRTNQPVESGTHGKQQANEQISALILSARKQVAAAAAISQETSSHSQRTPLLLPIRHFGGTKLREFLDEIESQVQTHPQPQEFVRQRCKEFEGELHPARSNRGGRSYVNDAGVMFAAPGRAVHGKSWGVQGDGHTPTCHLTALARVGGAIREGFHYDCTLRDGRAHSGTFLNCHDAPTVRHGKPHINVYPNDFIR